MRTAGYVINYRREAAWAWIIGGAPLASALGLELHYTPIHAGTTFHRIAILLAAALGATCLCRLLRPRWYTGMIAVAANLAVSLFLAALAALIIAMWHGEGV